MNMSNLRLGLCCQFAGQPIKFRNATVKHALSLPRHKRLGKLASLCRANAAALLDALKFCAVNGIGCFRVNSQILPLKSHAAAGYQMSELPDGPAIVEAYRAAGRFARSRNLRLTLHPDQFILLSSEDGAITERALAELDYHAEVAAWIGADVINIHGGGAYGDKAATLSRVEQRIDLLPDDVRTRLTLENDDRSYTPSDLLPLCRRTGVPFVYDVHHHRCLEDGMTVSEATAESLSTWDREPLFHLSSPLHGWNGPTPARHHDMIDFTDLPECWLNLKTPVTIEVEAKAKELAVLALRKWLDDPVSENPEF